MPTFPPLTPPAPTTPAQVISHLNRLAAAPAGDQPARFPPAALAPLRLFCRLLFLENSKQLHRSILAALAKLPPAAQSLVADRLAELALDLASLEAARPAGGAAEADAGADKAALVLPLAEPFASVIAMFPHHASGAPAGFSRPPAHAPRQPRRVTQLPN